MKKLQEHSQPSKKRSTEPAQRKSNPSNQGQPNRNQATNEPKHHRKNKSQSGQTDLPPNENLWKDPDEVYGDTEIRPDKGRA